MARTVAGSSQHYTARAMTDKVEAFGFDRDRAERIVAIAGTYGIKAEALPAGDMITIHLESRGYRMEAQT